MPDLFDPNLITTGQAGLEPVDLVENGMKKTVLMDKEDVKAMGGGSSDGGGGVAPDLTPYLKKAEADAKYATKTDSDSKYVSKTDADTKYATKTDSDSKYVAKTELTGATSATAADGLKLLLVDGTTIKQITLAELKTYLTPSGV